MDLRELNRHIKRRNIESAKRLSDQKIQIQGGTIVSEIKGDEQFVENDASYILDLSSGAWRVCV